MRGPENEIILSTHAVLKFKRDDARVQTKLRRRVLAGGDHKLYGSDYGESYSTAADFSLKILVLQLSLKHRL